MNLNKAIDLRKTLHKHPELSGSEKATAKKIKNFIDAYHPDQLIEDIGGHGLAAIFSYGVGGPTIAIRCELDALPIKEESKFAHRSINNGISHKCGHDGHMAIVAGLAPWLRNQEFKAGKVVLLFQPAEETGKGAAKVMQDIRFQALNIDYIFALHNIPGEEKHEIIEMKEGFSAEVQSFSIKFTGKESHAAEPEHGINPASAISQIIGEFDQLNVSDPLDHDFAILTPVHVNLGQKSYGISPGHGEFHYTIRTWSTSKMEILRTRIEVTLKRICDAEGLTYKVNWFEYFPASKNDAECNDIVKAAVKQNDMEINERPYPFKFGEDFGWYSKEYKTAMFGLGAGLNTPALHNANYDFPDEIIETGIKIFKNIITNILT